MDKKSKAATEQVQSQEREIYLAIYWWKNRSNTFEVDSRLVSPEQSLRDSVLTVDYNYTPWPRCGGNLLWT